MAAANRSSYIVTVPLAALVAAATAVLVVQVAARPAPDTEDLVRRVEALEKGVRRPTEAAARNDRALTRRIEDLEARVAAAAAASQRADTAAPPPDAATSALSPEVGKLHESVVVGFTSERSSKAHADAISLLADHLVRSAGPPLDETEFAWASRMLDREARRGRVSADEASGLEPILFALSPGHAARPALAKAVAMGWGLDERLGPFLGKFATNSEPAVHQGVLRVLDDEHPSPAFSEYVIRIVREEQNPEVLAFALNLDIVEAAATKAVAPRLVQTIERRVLDGTFEAGTRSLAGLAISIAAMRGAENGVGTLERLAERETDAEIADRYRRAAAGLRQGDATLKSLERVFD